MTSISPTFIGRFSQCLIVLLFLAGIFAPLIGTPLHWDAAAAVDENRRAAELPGMPGNYQQAAGFTDKFIAYWRDHFGFRSMLIRGLSLLQFHETRIFLSSDVVVGKNGWLFIRPPGDVDLTIFRGLEPMTEEQLDAWQQTLEKRNAWLAARHIRYLVVIPPEKQSIYPELMPDELAPVSRQSHLDQLIARLHQTHSPVNLVDLRPALIAAKGSEPLYFKTDTHWNQAGAYVGYCVIIDAINRLLPDAHLVPQPREAFGTFEKETTGDLVRLADWPDSYAETATLWYRRRPFPVAGDFMDAVNPATSDVADRRLPRVVLFHDSFANSLLPMLGPHFSHAVYRLADCVEAPLVEREKPDIVISEFAERKIDMPLREDSREIRETPLH